MEKEKKSGFEKTREAKENSEEPKKVPNVKIEPDMPTTSRHRRQLSDRNERTLFRLMSSKSSRLVFLHVVIAELLHSFARIFLQDS
uniref:Histone domain-containing protein n=1 Tax=Caenorhabditis tropicalis TaxID=1561998 RepID=A0A1I7UX46_9PELO